MNASNHAKEGSTLQGFQRTQLVTLVKTKHCFLQNEPKAWSDVTYSLITAPSSAIVSIALWNDCAWIDRNNPNEISRYINRYDTSIKIVPHSMQLVVPLDFEHCDFLSMVDKSTDHGKLASICLLDRLHTFSDILRRLAPLRRSGLRQQEVCVWKLTSRLITNIDKRNESFSLLELMYCAIIRVSYIHVTAITLSQKNEGKMRRMQQMHAPYSGKRLINFKLIPFQLFTFFHFSFQHFSLTALKMI